VGLLVLGRWDVAQAAAESDDLADDAVEDPEHVEGPVPAD
jgi:hypothetical protein